MKRTMKTFFRGLLVLTGVLAAALHVSGQSAPAPSSVPLKIWTVTDMNAVNSSDPYWTLDVDGTFLPSTPTANDAVTHLEKHGTTDGLVEGMFTDLGTVRAQPFQSYSVSLYSVGFLAGKICLAAPPGYQVWIDEQPRNSIFFDNPGQTLTYSATIAVAIIPISNGSVQPAGIASSLGTGGLDWHVSMGRAKNGDSAGELVLAGPGTQSDWSGVVGVTLSEGATEVARWGGIDANNVVHWQYVANEAVADTFAGSNGPEIWFYNPAQMSGSGVPRTFTGEPFVKYKLQVSSGTTLTITKETRDIPDATTTNVAVARTEVTSLTRTGTWPTFTWTVSDWTKSGDSVLVERVEQSTGTAANRAASSVVRTPGGATASSLSATFGLQAWGESLATTTAGSGSGSVTATYAYYTNPALFCYYGYPSSKTFDSGGWEAYNYSAFAESDPGGRAAAGIVVERFRPWGNSPSTPSTNSSLGEYTQFGYSADAFGFPTRPTIIKTKLNGTLVSDIFVAYTNVTALATGLPLVQATRTESTLGSSSIQTVTVYFGEDTADAFFRKKIHSIKSPDDRKTVYAYQRGTWSSGTFTPAGGTGLDAGAASRISVIRGTAAIGTLYSTHNGYNIDDVYLVEGKSTLETTIRDSRALVARTELAVWTSSGWVTLSFVDYAYDFVGRLTGSTTSTGAVYSATYAGQLLASETDATGVKLTYTYDAAARVSLTTREGTTDIAQLKTSCTYDAAGRVTQQKVGSDQTHPLTTTRTYDTAGHLTAETPPGLGATTYSYNTASRQMTATDPLGNTTVETRNLDGTLASVTGTATVAKYFSYGVETDGRQWTQANLGTSSSVRWEKSWVDRLGRPTRLERPGFTGQSNYVEEHTYHATTGLRTKTTRTGYASTLYTYDPLGQLARSGLDIDDNGTLDLASNDRITDTDRSFENWNSQWWVRAQTTGYLTAGSATPVTLSLTRSRLTGLTGGQSETRTTDVEGNVATATSTINRTAKTVTLSTAQTGLGTATQTSVNGFVTTATGFDGLTTTLQYDPFLRLKKSIDARNNATTTAYYDDTNLVLSVTDAAGNPVRTSYYDTAGRTLWVRDALNNYTYFDYNARSQIVHQWGGGAYPVEYGYDATFGDRTTQKTYRGGTGWTSSPWPGSPGTADTTTWAYDGPSGLLSSKTDANSKSVTFTYNQRGQVATRTWARGVSTTYGYHSATGELTGQTYSDGTQALSYAYTRAGQLDTVSDLTGTRDFVYDPTKPWRLSAEALTGYYGSRVVTPLYESGNVLGRDLGFQLGASAGSNSDLEQTWGYTSAGRFDTLATKRASNSVTRTFQYGYLTNSPLVNALSIVSGSFAVSYGYETQRDLVTAIDSKWSTTSRTRYDYTYNTLAQRDSAKQSGDAFGDFGGSTYHRYAYNGRGELVDATAYLGEDAASTTSPQLPGRHHAYTYDTLGNRLTSSRTGTAGAPDDYATNALNQYTTRENNVAHTAGTVASNTSIAVSITGNNGATLSAVGRAGRYWDAQATLANTSTPSTSLLTVTASLPGGGSGGATLVRTDTRTAYLAAALQNFSYDFDGNLIGDGVWNYTYDAENRLTQMTTTSAAITAGFPNRTVEFKYDYLGRRVQKRSLNATAGTDVYRRYLYDGWNVVAEFDATATTCGNLLRSYTWGLDLAGSLTATGGVGALLQITDGSATYLPTYDGNGNVVALLDGGTGTVVAKYEYSPFGELLRAEGSYAASNPFRFSTKFTDDETGLVYYGHRYYSPANGRFINRDPIEEQGGINLYGFCANDGINGFDVLGMDKLKSDGSVEMDPVVVGINEKPSTGSSSSSSSSGDFPSWAKNALLGLRSNAGETTLSSGSRYLGGFKSLMDRADAAIGVGRGENRRHPGLARITDAAGNYVLGKIEVWNERVRGIVNHVLNPDPLQVSAIYRAFVANDARQLFPLLFQLKNDLEGGWKGLGRLGADIGPFALALPGLRAAPLAAENITNTKVLQFADRAWFEDVAAYRALKADVAQNGLTNKLIEYTEIDGAKYVLRGNGRLSVAEELKITEQLQFKKVELPFQGYRTSADVLEEANSIIHNTPRGPQ